MFKSFVDSRFFYRFLEAIPATISWSILLSPILFSYAFPVAIGVFLAAFTFFWFVNTLEYTVSVIISQFKYNKSIKIDFGKIVSDWNSNKNLSKKDLVARNELVKTNQYINGEDVRHLVLIATYKEPFVVLDEALESITKSTIDLKKLYIVLAGEERAGSEQKKVVEKIQEKYEKYFGRFWVTYHPADIPGEVIGKGGNITYSARQVVKKLKQEKQDIGNIVVTTLDADHQPHKEFFNAVTYKYIIDEDRQHKSFQPIAMFYNNIWDVPMVNRLIATAGGFWHMAENTKGYRLHNFASHSQPLQALIDMDYWAVNTIVEDGHQYWRSYFHFHGQYEVEPIFLPIYQDAVQSANYKASLISQYKQIRRWAWGASDIPFAIHSWIKDFKRLPFWETLIHFSRLLESHIFWATGAIVITLATPIPEFLNADYARSINSSNISGILGFLFQIVLAGLILGVALTLLTMPKPERKRDYFKVVIQWLFVPIATIGFGSIPALESQTRLLLGKYLGFDVTEKVRTEKKD